MATQNFINECKNMANANRLGRFELQMYDRFEKEFKGDTFQQTYTGKNLCGIPDQTFTHLGVNVTIQDGEITLNGTATSSGTKNLTPIDTTTLSGNHTTNVIYISGSITGSTTGNFNLRKASDGTIINGSQVPFNSGGSNKVSINIPNSISIIFGIYVYNGTKYNNYKFRPQLVTGTSSDYNYEPYVGGVKSPNPSYPQAIENVTGLQNIEICGKNLLNADSIIPAMINSQSYSSSTLVYDNVTKTLTMTNPNTDTYLPAIYNNANNIPSVNINVKKNTTYTLHFDIDQPSSTWKNCVMGLDKSVNKYKYITNLEEVNTITFNTGNYDTIAFRIGSKGSVGTVTKFSNFQLEEGSTASEYEEYKGNTYEVNLGKNLFNFTGETHGSNVTPTITDNELEIIWTGGFNVYLTDIVNLDSAKTYTISFMHKGDSIKVGNRGSGASQFTTGVNNDYTKITKTFTGYSSYEIQIVRDGSTIDKTAYIKDIQVEAGSTATSYTPYFTPIELNSIPETEYQDKIYKNNGKWYIEKQIGKVVLDGSENYFSYSINDNIIRFQPRNMNDIAIPLTPYYSNYFKYMGIYAEITEDGITQGTSTTNSRCFIFINKSVASTVNDFKTWLSTHNTEVDYVLTTPTYTEITNEELINQLEAIQLLKGTNNIIITSENLPVIFDYSFWNGDTEVDEDDRFLEVNQSNYLTSIELKDSCCVNNNILGTTYTKSAEVELLDLPVGTKLESQIITPEIGVKYNDDTTEYETFDDYVIESLNDEQTASNTKFTAMNGSTLLDKEYICSLSFENGQTHTINEFYQDACNQIGLTPTDNIFDNSEIVMTGNPFTNKETIRTVISEVEKTSCSIAKFDWKNKTISLTWLSDQIDYEFNTSDYSTLEGSLTQYGPLNTIIIANAQLDGENVVMTDQESVEKYGEHQIIIDSPYFLYTEELRTQAIQAIYNKLDGLKYYDLKLTAPYGKPFLNIGNKIRINTNEGQTYDTYVLTHTLTYDGTIQSIIESPALTQEEQTIKNEFKGNSVREKLRRTELIVDKTTGDITAITDRVTTVENEFGDVYSKEEVNTLVQNSATGLTNTFINSGGNNLLRNTGLWFEDRSEIEYIYPSSDLYASDELFMSADPHWEYWKGNAKKIKEDKASNLSGILLQTGYLEQQQQVRNGTYTLSFKYRKLIELSTVNVQINDKYIELNQTGDNEVIEVGEITANNVSIKLFSDTDDSCVIYDLMLNAGSEKAEYSQHQNETTTDTVNISKGITISSSDTNTTFKANTDGIRIYNSKDMDNPVTDYTDTGMNTNRVKVKEEAEIVKVLWKDVGNNTWITRL